MIDKVGQIMNEAAQDKIMVATRNMATSIGEAIKGVKAEDERVAIIRKLINDIRFEPDKSGYFFVYKGTVNVILPPNAQIGGQGTLSIPRMSAASSLSANCSRKRKPEEACPLRLRQARQGRPAQAQLLHDDPRH